MLVARVDQIKGLGDETGVTAEDMGKAETALNKFGISVRGSNGDIKDMNTILQSLNSQWGSLSEQERSYIAENVAGNRHRATFLSLMKSITTEQNLYGKAVESTGALEKANEVKAESLQGKMNTLKDTVQVFFDTIISGNALKGGVDIFSNIIGGVTNVTKSIGTLPAILITAVGALTIFNAKFRESMTTYQPTFLTNWTNGLTGLKTKLTESIGIQKQNITSLRAYITEQQSAGNSTIGLQGKLALMQAGLVATTAKEVACTVATVALQTAFTMGLSLVITGIATALMSLASSSDDAKQKMEELSSSIKQNSDLVAQSQELLNKKTDLELKIAKTSEGTKENTELKKQLLDVERQISDVLPSSTSGFDFEGKAISANTELIKAQIQAKRDKIAVDAQELLNKAGDVNKSIKEAELMQKQIEAVKLAQKQGNPVASIPVDLNSDKTMEIRYANDYVSTVEKRLTGLKSTISETRLAILQLTQAGKSTEEIKIMYPDIDPSIIDKYTSSIEVNTKKQEENSDSTKLVSQAMTELRTKGGMSEETLKSITNTYPEVANNADKAKNKILELNNSLSQKPNTSTEDLTKTFSESVAKASELRDIVKNLNETHAMTPAIVKSVAEAIPDIGTRITSVQSVQEALNEKIKEEEKIQTDTYEKMLGNDSEYYSSKIKNSASAQSSIANILAQYINVDEANGLATSLQNFTTAEEAKAKVSLEIVKSIAGIWAQYWDSVTSDFTEASYGSIDLSGGSVNTEAFKAQEKKMGEMVAMRNKIRGAQDKLNGELYKGGASFNPSTFATSDGKADKKAESEAEKAQKKAEEIARLKSEIEPDRYLDFNNAVKQADNELSLNKSLMDSLKEGSPEYQQAELKNIEIYKEKQKALASLNEEQKKELEEKKKKLSDLGFEFDANNKLINSQQTLLAMQEKVNAMGGNSDEDKQAKEDAIKNLKEINDETKKYIELFGDKIPKTTAEWQEQANEIAKVNEQIKKNNEEAVQKLKDDLVKRIKEQREKQKEDTLDKLDKEAELKKDKLQKEYDAEKKRLETEKQAEEDRYDNEIKVLKKKLDDLDNTKDDKQAKLKALENEYSDWTRDDSTEAGKKKKDLEKEIKDLKIDIEKDSINSQIDSLNEQKDTSSKYYETEIKTKDDYYKNELDSTEEHYKTLKDSKEKYYKKMLSDKKIYADADKLITSNNQTAMLKILKDSSESYKEAGFISGKNYTEAFTEEINKAKNALNSLNGKSIDKTSTTSNNTSSSAIEKQTGTSKNGISYYVDGGQVIANGVISDSEQQDILKSASSTTSTSSSSSKKTKTNDNGSKTTDNNDGTTTTTSKDGSTTETSYKDSNGTNYTIVKHNDDISSYDTGGRTPSDIPDSGKLGVLHKDEKILNAKDTVQFDSSMLKIDDMYNSIKESGALIGQLSSSYANMGNYSVPNVVGNDLNKIINSMTTNNSNDNSNSNSVNIQNTYQVDATSDFKVKNFGNNLTKQMKNELRKSGILIR